MSDASHSSRATGSDLGARGNDNLADEYRTYIQGYSQLAATPADRLYLDVQRGHMAFLKPGEERFAAEESLARTLTGTATQILEKLDAIEATGVDNVVVSVTDTSGARDLIGSFGREVILKRK